VQALEDRVLLSAVLGEFVPVLPLGSLAYEATASSEFSGATVAGEDFNSGTLGGQWTTYSSDVGGRIQVTAGGPDLPGDGPPPGGDLTPGDGPPPGGGPPPPTVGFALLMDTVNNGVDNLNEAIWTVDLTGHSQAYLHFDHATFNDLPTPFSGSFTDHYHADGIAISNDGVHWHPIFDATFNGGDLWQSYSIDLTAEAAEAGLTLDDASFFIKFQQFGDSSIDPGGSLVSDGRGWDNIRIVAGTGETDTIPLTVDPGQSAQVIVTGDTGLRVSAQLYSGERVVASATASGPGGTVVLPLVHVPRSLTGNNPRPQTYHLVVSGAGDTLGAYDVRVLLNATLEHESHGGPGNNDLSGAQDLEPALIDLHRSGTVSGQATQPARAVVLGTTDSSPSSGIVIEVEGNQPPLPAPVPPPDLASRAQNIDTAGWNLGDNPDIFESTTLPHISIQGTGDGTFDYYSFTVTNAGDRAIFDIDYESHFSDYSGETSTYLDTMLFLYDSSGTLLAENDDFIDYSSPTFSDPGSNAYVASLIEYTFEVPGTYVIGVASFPSAHAFGQVIGTPIFAGDEYTLHISLQNHVLNGAGSDPLPEVEPNDYPPILAPDLTLFAQNVDGAGWNLGDNPDIFESTTLPHISIQGTGDGTFDYYSFTVTNVGDRAVFDLVNESTRVIDFFLYESAGRLIANSLDFDFGSDPIFTFDAAGTYVIGIARRFSEDVFGQIGGSPLLEGDSYTLHISLENHALNTNVSDLVAEVEPNEPPVPPPPDLSLFAQNLDEADWVLNFDPAITVWSDNFELLGAGNVPHVYVHGTGDGTFDYYSFTVTESGSFVGLQFLDDSFGHLEVFLYDASGVLLTRTTSDFSTRAIVDAGTYFIGVGISSSTDLSGQLIGPALPPGVAYTLAVSVEGHDHVLTAADTYRLDLRRGENILITASGQEKATWRPTGGRSSTTAPLSLLVEVVDRDGVVLATSASGSDDPATVIANFIAPASGTYYVRVTGDAAGEQYYLSVQRNAGLDLENNDSVASAQPVLGADAAGRSWVLGAIDKQLVVDAVDSGNWSDTGLHLEGSTYIVGYLPEDPYDPLLFPAVEYRNFFVFEVPALSLPIVSAQLRAANPGVTIPPSFGSPDGMETFTLFDVSTAIPELRAAGTGRTDIFDDLGTGTIYGSQVVTPYDNGRVVTVDLNTAAITDVVAHQGGTFAVGGALTTLTYRDDPEYAFAFAGRPHWQQQLVLTFADSDFYEISADANARLRIETATPGGGAGAFGNDFDAVIRLYDSAGNLVAGDDNSASDGRNASLSYKVPWNGGGKYYIEITSSAASGHLTTGEYLLSIQGHRTSASGRDLNDKGPDVTADARPNIRPDRVPAAKSVLPLARGDHQTQIQINGPRALPATVRNETSQPDVRRFPGSQQDARDWLLATLGRITQFTSDWEDGWGLQRIGVFHRCR
jgi:hypothetical protein